MRNLFVILCLIILCGSPAQINPQTQFPAAKKESKDPENNKLMKTVDGNQKQISDMLKKAQTQQNVKPKVVYIKVYSKPTSMAKKKYIAIDNGFIVDTISENANNKSRIKTVTDSLLTKVITDSTVKTKKSFFGRLFQKIKNI